MITATENPFKGPRYGEIQTYTLAAEDRVARVKRFDRRQCLAALALPDLQKTVARAVERRLRQLERGLV
jgi:hypothetical protein